MTTAFVPANLAEEGIHSEVYLGVQEIFSDYFGVFKPNCKLEARFELDLKLDSLDWHELILCLENAFGIEISSEDLVPVDILTNPAHLKRDAARAEWLLTDKGLAEMRKRLPWMNFSEYAKDPTKDSISSWITVGDLCRFVEYKLARSPTKSQPS